MRVIAGSLRGRRLVAPRGRGTRPTPDRVREALFSALGPLEGLSVLDLYAGSGALAIEALSRGAARAVVVERSAPALRALRQNLAGLELTQACEVLPVAVERAAALVAQRGPFALVLADPPYGDDGAGAAIDHVLAASQVLAPSARVAVEHSARVEPPPLDSLQRQRTRRYGDTAVTLYERDPGG